MITGKRFKFILLTFIFLIIYYKYEKFVYILQKERLKWNYYGWLTRSIENMY